MRRVPSIALALVAALAIALRFGRLQWGLDRDLWFADETVWSLRLRAFDHLSWRSFDTTGLGYPTLYQNVGGLGAWGASVLGHRLFGAWAIGWMRLVAATASVLAVLATMRLGTAMYGVFTGVVAGAFLAVAPLDAMQVHYASVEPLLVLWTTLTMAVSWQLARRGTFGSALLAGAAAGLATATKYPALAFVSAPAWAIVERWWQDRRLGSALRLSATTAATFVAAFALACPSCVVHADVLALMLYRHHQMAAFGGFEAACLAPHIGWWHRPWIYEIVAGLPYGLGLPLALLAMVGVVAALRRHNLADRLLVATLLPYFWYMGASSVVYPRYMLPLFPALALAAAALLAHLSRRRLATLVAVFVVVYGLALTTSQLRRFSWDQQAAVAEWLGDRAAALDVADRDVEIPGMLPADPYFRLRDPLIAKGFRVRVVQNGWLGSRPEFFVMPQWQAMAIHRDRRDMLRAAHLAGIERGTFGYRPVMRVPIPIYLQGPWDERWDPTFAVELWQGSIGFVVYARNDVLPELRTVQVLDPFPVSRPAAAPVAGSPSPG